jgi:aminoglycoside phosphotransferase family enzyme/predicted kinase
LERVRDSQQPGARYAGQREAIAFLSDPATHGGVKGNTAPVECFETHGNLVFLAGSEAWKIKRAVRFPYMDFSTLEKRKAACLREVEINRRFAPELYLGAVPITRAAGGGLELGGTGEPIEWAVHMRRFGQEHLLSNIAASGGIGAELAKAIADEAYRSHQGADRATAVSGAAPMEALVTSVSGTLTGLRVFPSEDVAAYQQRARAELQRCSPALDERARRGFVRRCHGDLHLANIVLWQGRPVFYDAIEFDEAIATIDTLYDLAFLLMDLDRCGHRHAANIILNHYLWRTNDDLDLQGLLALPLFLALRAGIRAMVTAERAAQESVEAAERDRDAARRYLHAALGYAAPASPRLVAVGGLSGTGKSTLGAALAAHIGCAPGAVHLRSDLERKTLFGVDETARLPSQTYTKEVSERVYGVLLGKARLALAAGHSVIVDAVYAAPHERQGIEAIATELAVPFRGLWLVAEPDKLAARVGARRNDASDATREVVAMQLGWNVGVVSSAWARIDAGGTADETLARAFAAAEVNIVKVEEQRP